MLEAGKLYYPCGVCGFVLDSEGMLRGLEELHESLGSNQYKWKPKVKPGSRKKQQKAKVRFLTECGKMMNGEKFMLEAKPPFNSAKMIQNGRKIPRKKDC
eukprot:Skav202833  [mRNA]  locus=scaffold746:25323:31320:+ [translate_table: standard]